MKKIYYLFMMCLTVFAAYSCSDDDDAQSATIHVEKADITFDAMESTGSILITAPAAFTAESDKDWCSVSVEQNVIKVGVTTNQDKGSRTALVTITCNQESLTVPVVQSGAVLVYDASQLNKVLGYDGGSFSLNFKSTVGQEVQIPLNVQEWISYEIDEKEETLTFTVLPSENAKPRTGSIVVKAGKEELVFNITQLEDLESLLPGNWDCNYLDAEGTAQNATVTIAAQNNNIIMTGFSSMGFPVMLTVQNNEASISAGTTLGKMDIYTIKTVVLTSDGMVTWNPAVFCKAVMQINENQLQLKFSNAEAGVEGFGFWAFDAAGKSAGYLELFYDLTITKNL